MGQAREFAAVAQELKRPSATAPRERCCKGPKQRRLLSPERGVEPPPMKVSCEACGTTVPARATAHAESERWHATEKGGAICPKCWGQQRDADPTVQAARRLGTDPADDRAEAEALEHARNHRRA